LTAGTLPTASAASTRCWLESELFLAVLHFDWRATVRTRLVDLRPRENRIVRDGTREDSLDDALACPPESLHDLDSKLVS
jgi:hypothetical protein